MLNRYAEEVKELFKEKFLEARLQKLKGSEQSHEEVADSLGIMPSKLVKCMLYGNRANDGAVLIVTSIDANIDAVKFKSRFRCMPESLAGEQIEAFAGVPADMISPFLLNADTTRVCLDSKLKRFDSVYIPVAESFVAKLSGDELFRLCGAAEWVDMCKTW